MLKLTYVVVILSLLLLLHQQNVEAATAKRRRTRRKLQKKSKSTGNIAPTTNLPDAFTGKKKSVIPKHCLYVEEEVLWTELFTDAYYEDDWWDPCRDYFLSIMPSVSPTLTRSPNAKPTVSPTKGPTSKPTVPPTDAPTMHPTDYPTKSPTLTPSKSPTGLPTKSGSPTLIEFYEVILPQTELKLEYGEVRRRLSQDGRKLLQIDVTTVTEIITDLVTAAFEKKYAEFFKVNLSVGDPTLVITKEEVTEASFPIQGAAIFTTDSPGEIPSDDDMFDTIVAALTSADLESIAGSKPASIRIIGSNQNAEPTIIVDGGKKNGSGTVTITVVACVIAVMSTLTALGLILSNRRKNNEEMETLSPSNGNAKEESAPKAPSGLRLRSPFPITSIGAGTGKYFLKLDDESLASKSQTTDGGKYILHPDISCVDSSFSRDEESSLEAPSLTGLSSICDYSKVGTVSVDGQSKEDSLTNMSALDEVRLGKVLDLDGSVLGENSQDNTAERNELRKKKSAFAKLWYGSKKAQKNQEVMESDLSCASDSLAPEGCDVSIDASAASAIANASQEINKLATLENDSPVKASVIEESSNNVAKTLVFDDDNSTISEDKSSVDETSETKLADEAENLYLLGSRSDSSVDADSMDFYGAPADAGESSGMEDSSLGESSGLSSNIE